MPRGAVGDPTIKGLALTSYDDENALTTAVLAGASGFLLKDVRGNGLVDAISRIAGENLLDTEQAHRRAPRPTPGRHQYDRWVSPSKPARSYE